LVSNVYFLFFLQLPTIINIMINFLTIPGELISSLGLWAVPLVLSLIFVIVGVSLPGRSSNLQPLTTLPLHAS
jgi:fumarate reductase subunit C